MKLRTLCLVVPATYLVCVHGGRLWDSPEPLPEPTRVASATQVVHAISENQEPVAEATEGLTLATLQEVHVTTPEEVREVLSLVKAATLKDCATLTEVALHAEDPLVSGNALKALGRLQAFSSDPNLLDMVADPRLRVRQDAVKACGLDGGESALPFLEQALLTGDDDLRPLVVEALGRIGGSQASALVEGIVEDGTATKTERVFARAALERINT